MSTSERTSGPRRSAEIISRLGVTDRPSTTAVPPAPVMDAAEQAEWNRQRARAYYQRNALPLFRHAFADHPDVLDWVSRYLLDPALAGSLMLFGVTGAGKTFQAFGAFAAIADSGTPAFVWVADTEPDLYARLRPSSGRISEEEFARVADAPLLLIDDLGAARDSDWTEEVMFRLVNHRHGRCLPTIFTTNVSLEKLKGALGERINSRLRQMCTLIVLDGPDRRQAR